MVHNQFKFEHLLIERLRPLEIGRRDIGNDPADAQSTSRISGLPALRSATRSNPAFSKTREDPT